MKLAVDQIYTVKLTSGEEIIGKLMEYDETTLILKDARSIILTGNGELKLGPVLFSIDKEQCVVLNRTAIAMQSNAIRKEFLDAYQTVVSPLTIPKSQILMG